MDGSAKLLRLDIHSAATALLAAYQQPILTAHKTVSALELRSLQWTLAPHCFGVIDDTCSVSVHVCW